MDGFEEAWGNAADPWVDGLPLGNGIGEEGAKVLGEALKANTTLTSLDLTGN